MSSRHLIRGSLALALLLLGCRDAGVVAPTSALPIGPGVDARRSDIANQGSGAESHPKPVQCAPHAPIVSRGVVGPRGGTVMIGDSRLIVPAGALSDTVTITGTALGNSSSTVQFAPHGLRFRHPAILVLSGEGCSLPRDGAASVVYLGPAGEVLETIEALYLPRWKLVGAPIAHFSGYAIAF